MDESGILKLLGGAAFTISVAVSAGIASIELLGYDLARVLWEMDGGTLVLDLSTAISIGLLGLVSAMSMPSWGDMRPEYQVAVALTIVVVGAGMVDPGFAADNQLVGLLAVAVTGAAYWGIQTGDCY